LNDRFQKHNSEPGTREDHQDDYHLGDAI